MLPNSKINHFYNTINGYMVSSNCKLFDHIISNFDSGTWVELGSWTGKSTAYNVVELINNNLDFTFYSIDTWEGGPEHQNIDLVKNDQLYDTFLENISPIKDNVNIVRSLSWEAASNFKDSSIAVCYIDADHEYDSVKKDIDAWWPKMKSGGYFCGDDYTKGFPGVQKAVKEFAIKNKLKVSKMGRCWLIIKP
jgi:hypothetical protein